MAYREKDQNGSSAGGKAAAAEVSVTTPSLASSRNRKNAAKPAPAEPAPVAASPQPAAESKPAAPVEPRVPVPVTPAQPPAVPAHQPPAPVAPAAAHPPQARPSSAPKKPSWVKRGILGAVLLAVVSAGGYFGHDWWVNGRYLVSTDDAYVRADITVLASKVTGYVQSMNVTDNQRVKAGDLIAVIDPGDYRIAVDTAKAKIETQKAVIDRMDQQIAAAQTAVVQAQTQVESAQAESQRATSESQRQSSLAQSGFATRQKVEETTALQVRAEAAVHNAQAALDAARANIGVLTAQKTEEQRTLGELQTTLEKAQRDLSFTEIHAPVDGIIANRAVEVGAMVQPGNRIAAIVPLDSVHIDAQFKETQLGSVQPGQPVSITVDAYPGRRFEGTVESIAPGSSATFSILPPENATGNFTKIVQRVPVRVAVPRLVAEQGLLRPGLSVEVTVDSRDVGRPNEGPQTAQSAPAQPGAAQAAPAAATSP
ncbi:MAG: HlyD family secretion protein [Hyphomicrobiales bacterium]